MRLAFRGPLALVLAAVIILGAGASGCGGGTDTPAAGGGGNTKVLTMSYGESWASLDPNVAYGAEPDVLAQIYQTLTSYSPGPGAKVEPDLATSWSASAGGRTWTFKLRHGVKFQDGEAFTSAAVKISLERLLKLDQGAAYVFKPITSIDTPSTDTVVFHLSASRPLDAMLASGYGAYIMSPKTAAHPSSWFQSGRGYGTGPYMWKSYTRSQSAVITKFDGYWGGWHSGQVTTLVYSFTPDASTRVAQLVSGSAQVADDLPLQDVKSLESRSGLAVHPIDILAGNYLTLNTTQPPFTDVAVRQAILDTFPTQQVINTVYGSICTANTSLIPRSVPGSTTGQIPATYNLDTAKHLLAQAGHPTGGFSFSFMFNNAYPEQAQIAQLWKAALAQVGVTLNIHELSFGAYESLLQGPKPPPASAGGFAMIDFFPPNYPSASEFLGKYDNALTGDGMPFYSNPKVTQLINQGLAQEAGNPAAAHETYAEAERLIYQASTGFNVCDRTLPLASSTAVTGWTSTSATWSAYDLRVK
jgi:peptide/nickel transport system substrate-binding protein